MEQDPPEIDEIANYVSFFEDLGGKATAYVCINKTCKPPTSDFKQVLAYLNSKWKK